MSKMLHTNVLIKFYAICSEYPPRIYDTHMCKSICKNTARIYNLNMGPCNKKIVPAGGRSTSQSVPK